VVSSVNVQVTVGAGVFHIVVAIRDCDVVYTSTIRTSSQAGTKGSGGGSSAI
jgi:hypothetical protein